MANQIVISSGAKVRNLNGVLTGTTGVVNSLGINVANGIPQLDGSGKILVSQLPNSVMEYKGTWNAATNTPTLVNGTGNQGDVYLCNVAGTVNFGAGAITFAVGDQAIYSGTIWQKAGGSTGTVTSVAVTETGDALTITGSPITTSGTINIGFAGTSGQYVNGAGGLTTFPTLISSIGLSMPSAFTVTNSPLTANGTIAVTGAGVASQYVRGDGTLANFPTSGGGGGSVSYYFNSSVSQGTLGGVAYRELNKVPVIGAGTDITIATNGYIANYITDVGDPALLEIPGGNWNFEVYFSASSAGGTPSFYVELYKYDGTTFTLISSNSATPEGITGGTAIDLYTTALAVPTTALTLTDRLAVRVYVNNSGRTITLHTENSHLCQVITTFSTGITALNGLTAQVQYFGTGTSGTDFNISSATATHTFNLPVASATNTGKLSSTDWSTFNNKLSTSTAAATYVPYTGATANLNLGTFGITSGGISSSGIALSQTAGVSSTGSTTINGDANGIRINPVTASNNTLSFPASGSRTYTYPNATGTLALTSDIPSLSGYIQGSGTTNYVPKFTASGTIGNSLIYDTGTRIAIGGTSATYGVLTVQSDAGQFCIQSNTTPGKQLQIGYDHTTNNSYLTSLEQGVAFTNLLLQPNGGNVGIGTSVVSTGYVGGNGSLTLQNSKSIAFNNFSNAWNTTSAGGAITYFTDNNLYIDAKDSASNMIFRVNGATERMRITSGGAIGMNTSSPDSATVLTLRESSSLSGALSMLNRNGNQRWSLAVDAFAVDDKYFSIIDNTNSAVRMVITPSGNVGIGTSSPLAIGGFTTLEVKGSSAGLIGVSSGASSCYGLIYNPGTAFLVGTNTNHALTFITNDTGKMDITAAGHINMNATVYNNTAVAVARILYIGSDYRIGGLASIRESKKNIENISNVDWIYSLNPVTFNYRKKDEEEKYTEEVYDELVYGLIAEDTAQIADFLVNYNAKEDGTKEMVGIEYMRLITPMLKAIQELKAEIDELKALIAAK